MSTHAALVARAFGADGIILADRTDHEVEKSVRRVVELWGGPFFIESGKPWRGVIRDWKNRGGEISHLTMYGIPIQERISEIRESPKDKLVVIGAEKVPGDIYRLADYNLSVTQQPHSEIAALAIFLHLFFQGAELKREFCECQLKVLPSEKGKRVQRPHKLKIPGVNNNNR